MKVLIAGATGYLGSHIVTELKKKSYFIRTITRNSDKLKKRKLEIDEIFEAEITKPETLTNCCDGIDIVITTIGITKQKDGLTYMNVDYQANLNLLNEAIKSNVKKFIYVFVANSDKMQNLKIIQAKQLFVDKLTQSGLKYCIIKPNGFFADMGEFLEMAKKGSVYVFGKGDFKINPIHGEDLAKACVENIDRYEKEVSVGGPETLTHNQIAEFAFNALGKKAKIVHVPIWVKSLSLFLLRTFKSVKTYGPVEFFMTVMTMNMTAPEFGTHTLKEFFASQVSKNQQQ